MLNMKKILVTGTYSINIDNESDVDVLTSEELTALLNAPRIPEVSKIPLNDLKI